MRKPWLSILWLLLFSAIAVAQEVDVREETLTNGMRLLMVERHESPVIAAGWVARVGSVNERLGITGISHLFEHLMFKGTETIGTRDYEADKQVREQQDAVYEQMQQEYRKLREMRRQGKINGSILDPANQTPRLKELRVKLEQLFEKERELIVKDELDQIYTREGASGLNAGTTEDQTFYFVTVPANKLELWFWLESDRLLNPVFREFYAERNVVREERRMRVESTPTGRIDEIFRTMFWQSSPYNWPVIGWASDVEAISREQAEDYFSTYYAPNNITAVLVGDFDSDRALELAQKYFGRVPRGENEPPEVITEEIVQDGEKRFHASAETNPQVGVRYHAVPFNHADEFALRVLAEILNGRTGRLYRSLVEEKEVAVGQPFSSVRALKYEGYFELGAQVKEGVDPVQVESALLAELQKLKEEPVGDRELQKIKNQEMANSFRRLQSNFGLLVQLLFYDSLGDWRYLNESSARIQGVTPDDIQDVANRYFSENQRNVFVYVRKEGSAPDDALFVALPEELKPMVKSQLAQINQISDVEQLKQILAQSEQALEQAPAEARPAVEYLVHKISERIDQLSNGGQTGPQEPDGENSGQEGGN